MISTMTQHALPQPEFGHWRPGSRLVEGLICCFAVGVIWLGTEIFQKKKPREDE